MAKLIKKNKGEIIQAHKNTITWYNLQDEKCRKNPTVLLLTRPPFPHLIKTVHYLRRREKYDQKEGAFLGIFWPAYFRIGVY